MVVPVGGRNKDRFSRLTGVAQILPFFLDLPSAEPLEDNLLRQNAVKHLWSQIL